MKPKTSSGNKPSAVWIVPVVALAIGIWMVIHTIMSEGPEVILTFNTAEDLVAGKTKIKLLDVDIGQVETVALNPDASGVTLTLRLEKDYENLLRDDTRFWVERARIGAGGVSGLGTLLSGAYIKLSPGEGKIKIGEKAYTGMEAPPLTPSGAPGVRLTLESDHASSVSAGNSVLYNGYQVGRVENMSFDQPTQKMRYDIFIDAPYDKLVTSSVRFWNMSGIELSASAEGFSVNTGSLDTILSGGVSFGLPAGAVAGVPVQNDTVFKLYDTQQQTLEHPYKHGAYYVVSFNQSIGGLVPGAPVQYRGIDVGSVQRILVKELVAKGRTAQGASIPVLIRIEPGRMELGDTQEALEDLHTSLTVAVGNGMRASLATGNLLTGSLKIEIDYYPDEPEAEIGKFNQYPALPTISGGFDRIQHSISKLLDKLNALPLDQTVTSANNAIGQLDNSLASLDKILGAKSTQAIPAKLNATLDSLDSLLSSDGFQSLPQQLSSTLSALEKTLNGLSPDSQAYKELSRALYEFTITMQNLDDLTRSLSNTATLLPSPDKTDPTPEALRP